MRKLSEPFLEKLRSGFLADITRIAKKDHDLNLEVRDNFINLYYKSHSLLKLSETNQRTYKVDIPELFREGTNWSSNLNNYESVNQLIANIPIIKQNIINKVSRHSLEGEYEQMIIRANNYEPKIASEYFIVDRQYVINESKFDLTGFYWENRGRRKNQEVPMCLMELKFALNPDIVKVHKQLKRYYEDVKPQAASIAEEGEKIFKQKLELGLYNQSQARLEMMKTLHFARGISQFQFVLVLVDHNPNSSALQLESLKSLPFANQVKIFKGGFGMWKQNTIPIKK